MKQIRTGQVQKILFYVPLALYIAFITVLLVTRFSILYRVTGNPSFNNLYPTRSINLTPFQTMQFYTTNGKVQYLDIYANVLLFVPLGVYVHAYSRKKRVLASALTALLLGLAVEGLQLLLYTGSFDIDDILLNLLGSLIGIAAYHGLFTACKHNEALSRDILGAVSFSVIPLLLLTVVQDVLWLPRSQIALASLLVLLCFYTIQACLLRHAEKPVKAAFLACAVLLVLLYYAVVLPGVSPP